MTADRVQAAGAALFGPTWRKAFEDKFGISARKLRRVISGKETVGQEMSQRIECAMWDRLQELTALLEYGQH